jgi:hypothetical protein
VLSQAPVRIVFPSGEKATDLIKRRCPLKVRSCSPVVVSQRMACSSASPVSTRFPSAENATASTSACCRGSCFSAAAMRRLLATGSPSKLRTTLPVATSHSVAVLSGESMSTNRPSGDSATRPCPPRNTRNFVPVAASHKIAVSSEDPVRIHFPSREKATDSMPPVCPTNRRTTVAVAASQRMAALSVPPVRTLFPSGENATDQTPPKCPVCSTSSGTVAPGSRNETR